MNNKKIIKWFIWLGIISCFSLSKSYGQENAAAIAAADTTNFSVNDTGGWQLYNSYVAALGDDSVQLELIVQHNNNINWNDELYVGKIKPEPFLPSVSRSVVFDLITVSYQIRIDTGGRCYIRFVSGLPPSQDPFIIPVKVRFKK